MAASLRFVVLAALLLPLARPAAAQERHPSTEAYTYERSVVEAVVGTLGKVIREATLHSSDERIGAELRAMADRLSGTTGVTAFAPGAGGPQAEPAAVTVEDLRRLEAALNELYTEIQSLRRSVEGNEDAELLSRISTIEVHTRDALDLATQLAQQGPTAPDTSSSLASDDAWWDEPTTSVPDATSCREDDDCFDFDEWDSDRWNDDHDHHDHDDWDDKGWRDRPAFARENIAESLFGTLPQRWPYAESAVYNTPPAIRHNRVEGLVLGIAQQPLELSSARRAKLYGQAGYAFGMDEWRYEIGGELRLDRPRRESSGFKVGAAYRRNTVTEDLWKSNWIENTLAAFLFRNDFFDYYEAEGVSVYGIGRVSPILQVSAGFRAEEHRGLTGERRWSLFGGGGTPRENPFVDEGQVRSFVAAVEGGRVRNLNYLPRGFAFRLEGEVDPDLGDRQFSRFVGDGRLYLMVTERSNLALRLRGGVSSGTVPFQKLFRLGGVGSMRGYPQNFVFGERMLLGNAELAVAGPELFDEAFEDLLFFGFADAGYAGESSGREVYSSGELFPSAGVGVALEERNLRLELAWPLKDAGFGMAPSLWFRLSPTF